MSNNIVLEGLSSGYGTSFDESAARPQRKRVYIFLTRFGLIYLLNLLVMLIGAINYNNSLAYALTFLLGGLFLVAMLHTWNSLRGLVIRPLAAEPVFAGQQATFPLVIDNRTGGQRPSLLLQLASRKKTRLRSRTVYSGGILENIPAASLHSVRFPVKAEKRGYLLPGRIRISSTWPLGLFRAWSYIQVEEPCTVYPKPGGNPRLPAAGLVEEEEALPGKGSGSEDFVGFRQYRSGDSMRSVDWKAYARERGLVSKRFSGRGSSRILLDWQLTGAADTEQRLSQLCRWILEAERQKALYGLRLPGKVDLPFASGNDHKHRCLACLAGFGLHDA